MRCCGASEPFADTLVTKLQNRAIDSAVLQLFECTYRHNSIIYQAMSLLQWLLLYPTVFPSCETSNSSSSARRRLCISSARFSTIMNKSTRNNDLNELIRIISKNNVVTYHFVILHRLSIATLCEINKYLIKRINMLHKQKHTLVNKMVILLGMMCFRINL